MRILLLFALVAGATGNLSAQRDSTAVLRTSGAFFAVSVSSLQRSQAWYEQTFGLRVTLRPPPSNGVTALVLEGGGLMVELIGSDKSAPAQLDDPVGREGLFKVGVIVDNYDAVLQRIRDRGIPFDFGPFPGGNGQRPNFAIRDPDKTLIQFFGR